MKGFFFLAMFCLLGLEGFTQVPLPFNDNNWVLNWSDEFDGATLNKTVWMTYPWWNGDNNRQLAGNGVANMDNDIVMNPNALGGGNGYVSLLAKANDVISYTEFDKDLGHDVTKTRTGYSCGFLTTGRGDQPLTSGPKKGLNRGTTFGYGFYEVRVKFPNDYNHDKYGSWFDAGFWMYEKSKNYTSPWTGQNTNIDWQELDFEINTNSGDNTFTINTHLEEPFGNHNKWEKAYEAIYEKCNFIDPHTVPAHFANRRISPDVHGYWEIDHDNNDTFALKSDAPTYMNLYEKMHLLSGWHKLGMEWLPDQIKFYIDDKLWFRLEADRWFDYVDAWGAAHHISPIHEMVLPMPLLL